MVRIDKIIYMITCFKSLASGLEDSQYSLYNKDILIDDNIIRVLYRLGVIADRTNTSRNQQELFKSIPLGRESFLLSNTKKHSKEVCELTNPNCELCNMYIHCDYYNNKNIWVHKENI
tara:strand:+ start:23 stop:376 length:354 start_codon:yes stop_codon:yes gene_type:complete